MEQPQPYIYDGIFYSSKKRSRCELLTEKYNELYLSNKESLFEREKGISIFKKFKCRENILKRCLNNNVIENPKKIKIN